MKTIFITTVERPVLTEEERSRRMEELKRATVELLKSKRQPNEKEVKVAN